MSTMGRISLVLTDSMCRSESLTRLLGRSYSPTAIERQFSNTLNQTLNKEASGGGNKFWNISKGSVLPMCHSRGLTYQQRSSTSTLFEPSRGSCPNVAIPCCVNSNYSQSAKHFSIFVIIWMLRVQSSNTRLSNQALWSCATAKCRSTGFGREPEGHIITPTPHTTRSVLDTQSASTIWNGAQVHQNKPLSLCILISGFALKRPQCDCS